MTDTILDWSVVVLPTLLGILGLWFSLKAPPESAHRKWEYSLLVVGIVISGLTYLQQARARSTREAEIQEHREAIRRLQQTIEAAEARSVLEFAFIRERLDSKELVALRTTLRDYARNQRAKAELSNRQLRQRATSVARRMREFQLRYDFEESEITRRWLQELKKLEIREEAERRVAERHPADEKPPDRDLPKPTDNIEELRTRSQELMAEIEELEKDVGKIQARIEARNQLYSKTNEEQKALTERYVSEFNNSLLPEAAYVREETLKRLPPQPAPRTFEERMQVLAFQGVLVSPRAVGSAADYLENLAKKL
ncbi:MAG: hypothetical protein L0338_11675 [Acidobacteria bacterium]|nr:hypothetical protein [Acidobacteriota bacterium]